MTDMSQHLSYNNNQKAPREDKPPPGPSFNLVKSYFMPKLLLVAQYLSDCQIWRW